MSFNPFTGARGGMREQGDESDGRRGSDSRPTNARGSLGGYEHVDHPSLDLEFEWYQLCHACGNRKRFSAMICDDCRERHGV